MYARWNHNNSLQDLPFDLITALLVTNHGLTQLLGHSGLAVLLWCEILSSSSIYYELALNLLRGVLTLLSFLLQWLQGFKRM